LGNTNKPPAFTGGLKGWPERNWSAQLIIVVVIVVVIIVIIVVVVIIVVGKLTKFSEELEVLVDLGADKISILATDGNQKRIGCDGSLTGILEGWSYHPREAL